MVSYNQQNAYTLLSFGSLFFKNVPKLNRVDVVKLRSWDNIDGI